MKQPIQLSHFTAVSALGYGVDAHLHALLAEKNALRRCDYPGASLDTYIGRTPELENVQLPADFSDWYSRNNLLAYAALQQDNMFAAITAAKAKYGAKRIGLLLGTTTSGFSEAEHAYQARDAQGELPATYVHAKKSHPFATTSFLRTYLELAGPAMTIATACSSSAKAFITASHWLDLDVCDAVLVGGIDSLCLNILYGFHSLGILSTDICRPFDEKRTGLSLGEAAALVLV
jgi:3-oxoacyl-[acyl-carrier-protein] synthase-1